MIFSNYVLSNNKFLQPSLPSAPMLKLDSTWASKTQMETRQLWSDFY